MKTLPLLSVLLLAACTAAAPPASPPPTAPDRPMDEVPAQQVLPGGDREYRFDNGCVIVLEADQAVLRTESDACELYQRDIALLYAAGD